MEKAPKSEAYIEDPKSEAYNTIMDSYVEATKPPKLSEKGEEAYEVIQGLQNACYDIAEMTGELDVYRGAPGKVKEDILSMKNRIIEYVAALPEEEQDLITERLRNNPTAYYSAWAVMEGIEKEKAIEGTLTGFSVRDEIEKRIGKEEELYNRVDASLAYDRGEIGGKGSKTYERAKKLWERVSREERWQELPEEEKRYLEEYFGEEKEEGVRKDVERKANEESK